jgi:hypothetical protein
LSFLSSLSVDARDELRAFVNEAVRDALAARDRADARQEWLTTMEVGQIISSTENAVRCRLSRGWLADDVTRDGKRLLVRKSALLDHLERRAGL